MLGQPPRPAAGARGPSSSSSSSSCMRGWATAGRQPAEPGGEADGQQSLLLQPLPAACQQQWLLNRQGAPVCCLVGTSHTGRHTKPTGDHTGNHTGLACTRRPSSFWLLNAESTCFEPFLCGGRGSRAWRPLPLPQAPAPAATGTVGLGPAPCLLLNHQPIPVHLIIWQPAICTIRVSLLACCILRAHTSTVLARAGRGQRCRRSWLAATPADQARQPSSYPRSCYALE